MNHFYCSSGSDASFCTRTLEEEQTQVYRYLEKIFAPICKDRNHCVMYGCRHLDHINVIHERERQRVWEKHVLGKSFIVSVLGEQQRAEIDDLVKYHLAHSSNFNYR